MKNYKAIIFDLDGTLLDTLDDLRDSTNYALKSQGYPERTKEEVRRFLGNGGRKLIERSVPEKTDQTSIDRIFAIFKKHYADNMTKKTCPYDGILEALKTLKTHGKKLAIVSNKFDAAVKGLNDQFFSEYIDTKDAIGESSLVAKKPAPDTCLEAMRMLHVSPEEVLYVGDSDVDIETAKNSGVSCVSVTWGFRDKEFLLKHGASMIIDTPLELVNFILKKDQ